MPTLTTDLACLNQSLEKIRQMLRENPHEAECLLDECPEMVSRIQEIVDLLREVQQA